MYSQAPHPFLSRLQLSSHLLGPLTLVSSPSLPDLEILKGTVKIFNSWTGAPPRHTELNCDVLRLTQDSGKLMSRVTTRSLNFPVCIVRQAPWDFPDWAGSAGKETEREEVANAVQAGSEKAMQGCSFNTCGTRVGAGWKIY